MARIAIPTFLLCCTLSAAPLVAQGRSVVMPPGTTPSPILSPGIRVGNMVFAAGQLGLSRDKPDTTIGGQTKLALEGTKRYAWVGHVEDITVPTKFVVTVPIDGYAVEIRGNYRTEAPFNRYDGYLPRVVVECNYRSRGVHLRLIDNAVIDAIEVHQANGTGLHAEGIRQSHLRSIWVTECDSDKEPAVDFVNIDRDKADASNGCTIDHLQVLACSNPTYLHLVGRAGQPIALSVSLIQVWKLPK